MTTIEKVAHFQNLFNSTARRLNKSLLLTTAESSRKEIGGQLEALYWVKELVLREVVNEQNDRDIQEKEEE